MWDGKTAYEDSRDADGVANEGVQVAAVGIENWVPSTEFHNGKLLTLNDVFTGLISFDLDILMLEHFRKGGKSPLTS